MLDECKMQVKGMLSEAEALKAGTLIVDMLSLTKNKEGKYNTSWGAKTLEGIGRCIQRIVEESKTVKE